MNSTTDKHRWTRMSERGSVTRSNLKIRFAATALLLTELRSKPVSNPCLSVSIRVQVVKTRITKGFLDAMDGHCQRNCQFCGEWKHNSPLSGQYPAETRPLHFNVSRRFWCMMQTHAHENKIHPVS